MHESDCRPTRFFSLALVIGVLASVGVGCHRQIDCRPAEVPSGNDAQSIQRVRVTVEGAFVMGTSNDTSWGVRLSDARGTGVFRVSQPGFDGADGGVALSIRDGIPESVTYLTVECQDGSPAKVCRTWMGPMRRSVRLDCTATSLVR